MRSSNRTTRRSYADDVFAAVPELQGAEGKPKEDNEDSDDFVNDDEQSSEDESASEGDATSDDSDGQSSDGEDVTSYDDNEENVRNMLEGRPRFNADGTLDKRRKAPLAKKGEIIHRGLYDASRTGHNASSSVRRVQNYGPDHRIVQAALMRWGANSALPTKAVDSDGRGGFARPRDDSELYQRWREESEQLNKDQLFAGQVVTDLTNEQAQAFVPEKQTTFLLGPYEEPTQFKLSSYNSVDTSKAWAKERRPAIILNAGARVKQVEWLPQCSGSTQYLAVSLLRDEHPGNFSAIAAPAFTPNDPTPTALQIWSVQGQESPSSAKIAQLVCTEFGELKAFQFCPHDQHILAAIYGDGYLRVIYLPKIDTAIHVEETAIQWKPPDTVFTCLAWMSPSRIAAGCANGCVAVCDLGSSRPHRYAAIASSYITGVISCHPTFPELIVTTSLDGHTRLTDTSEAVLTSPAVTVTGVRFRAIINHLVWHDYAQLAIFGDDAFSLRGHLIRRFFNTSQLNRLDGPITSLAASTCHPFILVGTANGDVISMNPITKHISKKALTYQQKWFLHEWRRPRDDEGLSRFVEGFKTQKLAVAKESKRGAHEVLVIHEKPTAITALAWNPNLHVGGWAAAGMGDGLVRIEDISL